MDIRVARDRGGVNMELSQLSSCRSSYSNWFSRKLW